MKYLRRTVWYLTSRLLLLCVLLGLGITIFYYAMNLTNIQIVLKDGMANRAKVIMGIADDQDELKKYFQNSVIANDTELKAAALGNSRYENYNIRGIDHRLEMGFLWVWPWESSVRVTVTESIPRIDGRVKGLKADEVIARDGAKAVYPPEWPDAQYRILLTKEAGQWKIRSMTLMK
ncbi:MAG: hypothetical protein IJG94_02475 [Clostridia bacterium]|nr:hypothetical protein [Clostridia bacterium]